MCSVGAAGIGIVWWLDRATGPEIAFSVFYVLPVAFVVWYGGQALGTAAAVLAAFAWLAADVAGRTYSHPSIHGWNALVRLAVYLIVAGLLDRLRKAREKERALALTDPLTGSANTRAFYARLRQEIARSRRTCRPFGLVYFDLDDFKAINDRHGHVVGDRLLQAVAARARAELREIDLAARLGGDEFAVLLVNSDPSSTLRVLQRLRSALLEEMREKNWPVTFSFGATTFVDPPAGTHAAIQAADALMYEVKAAGKDGTAHQVFERSGTCSSGDR